MDNQLEAEIAAGLKIVSERLDSSITLAREGMEIITK